MNSDTAAADFNTVQNQIVGFGFDCQRVALKFFEIFIKRRGERMVDGRMSFLLLVPGKHREIHNPAEGQFICINQAHFLTEMKTQAT